MARGRHFQPYTNLNLQVDAREAELNEDIVVLNRKEIIVERKLPQVTPTTVDESNKRQLDSVPKRRKNRPDR